MVSVGGRAYFIRNGAGDIGRKMLACDPAKLHYTCMAYITSGTFQRDDALAALTPAQKWPFIEYTITLRENDTMRIIAVEKVEEVLCTDDGKTFFMKALQPNH